MVATAKLRAPAPRPAAVRRPPPAVTRPAGVPARNGMQGTVGNAATARAMGNGASAATLLGGAQDGVGNSRVAAALGAPAANPGNNREDNGGGGIVDSVTGFVTAPFRAAGRFLADQGWALLERYAPELVPILRQGIGSWLRDQLANAMRSLLWTLTAPVRAIGGVVGMLKMVFAGLVGWVKTGVAKIVSTSCAVLSDAADKFADTVDGIDSAEAGVLGNLKDLAGGAGRFLGGLWDKLGAPVADLLGGIGSAIWNTIQDVAGWLWDKTEPIRDIASRAWSWFKDLLGIGDGPEGRSGIIQWVRARAQDAWNWIKERLGPIATPLKIAGGVLLLLSPAGPFLAAGALAFGVVRGARWLWENLREPGSLVRLRKTLVNDILPPLIDGVGTVIQKIKAGAGWLSGTLTSAWKGLRSLAADLTAPILFPLAELVNWLGRQAGELVDWVDKHVLPLSDLVSTGLTRLKWLGSQLLTVLKKVISVVANPFGIVGLIQGAAWRALPACMRRPILTFLLAIVKGALKIMPVTLLGPLGTVIREAMVGFIDRALEEANLAKLELMANRFAKIATEGSWDFTVGYGLGLLRGVWDGISGPFILLWDIAKLVGNGIAWLARTAVSGMTPAMRELVNAIRGGWEAIRKDVWPAVRMFFSGPVDVRRIIQLVRGVMSQIAAAARDAGSQVFDSMMKFLRKPDRQLGESIGFVTGIIVFEVTLTVLTAGGYAAKPVIQRVAQLFTKAATRIGELFTQMAALLPRITRILHTVRDFAATNPAMRRIVAAVQKIFDKFLAYLRWSFGIPGQRALPRPSGGRAGIGEFGWLDATNPRTGRPFQRETLDQEIEALRLALLRTHDIGRVQGDLSRMGVRLDRSLIEQIKRYNFDSPGLGFHAENYFAWRRLATGRGTLDDVRYLVHEAAEIGALDRIRIATGFDFMGRRFDQLSPMGRRQWLADFDRYYRMAHAEALTAEYRFLADRVQSMTNGQVRIGPVLAAVADPRDEGRLYMLVDGVLLQNHPRFSEWLRRAGEELTISQTVQRRLGFTRSNVTLRELIQAIKRARS